MPRFLVERNFGTMTDEEMQEVNATLAVAGREDFPDIVWEGTHVCHSDDTLMSFCVYTAPSAERLYEHADRVGREVTHQVYDIVGDIDPNDIRT